MSRMTRTVLAAAAITVLAGCGSGTEPNGPPPPGWTNLGNSTEFTCHGPDGVYVYGMSVFVLPNDPECAQ